MSIYHLKDNTWCDYVEEKAGIMTNINGEWIDGASDESAPPVSVHVYNNGKFIQKYPVAQVTYTDTYTASNLKFTHTQSTSWGTDTTKGDTKAGIWQTTAIYSGWLGLTSPKVSGGKGNVEDIINVNVKYNRRGVGNWEKGYPLALVLSNLTSPNVGGYTAHYTSKKLNTFYSDTNMVTVPGGTSAEQAGTTTMNNTNAKNMLKTWMNSTGYSILLGYKESSNTPYIGLYGLSLEITYTCNINKAIFVDVPTTYNVDRNNDGNVEMWIYDDELDLSYIEIIKRREALGRQRIKDKDVKIK